MKRQQKTANRRPRTPKKSRKKSTAITTLSSNKQAKLMVTPTYQSSSQIKISTFLPSILTMAIIIAVAVGWQYYQRSRTAQRIIDRIEHTSSAPNTAASQIITQNVTVIDPPIIDLTTAAASPSSATNRHGDASSTLVFNGDSSALVKGEPAQTPVRQLADGTSNFQSTIPGKYLPYFDLFNQQALFISGCRDHQQFCLNNLVDNLETQFSLAYFNSLDGENNFGARVTGDNLSTLIAKYFDTQPNWTQLSTATKANFDYDPTTNSFAEINPTATDNNYHFQLTNAWTDQDNWVILAADGNTSACLAQGGNAKFCTPARYYLILRPSDDHSRLVFVSEAMQPLVNN